MITKMKKYDIKDLNMNGKILFTACLTALFSLSGCALFQKAPIQENVTYADTDTQICPQGVCETDPFINYTQTRADYGQYGELSERDVRVSEAGAGNNLSAAIPPSVENEVIEYEERLESDTAHAEEASVQNPGEENIAATQETAETVLPQTATVLDNGPNSSVALSNAAQDEVKTAETALPETSEATVDASNDENKDDGVSNSENQAADENTQESEEKLESANESKTENEDEEEEDPVRDWYAEEGQNLKALLTEWSELSGWRIVWNTNRNYVLNAGAMFRGRFADVSSALIRAFARARPAPVATFYKGNRVLVVETMEDENAYD